MDAGIHVLSQIDATGEAPDEHMLAEHAKDLTEMITAERSRIRTRARMEKSRLKQNIAPTGEDAKASDVGG